MQNRRKPLSDRDFLDHITCPYMAYLRLIGQRPDSNEYLNLQSKLTEDYEEQARRWLARKYDEVADLRGTHLRSSVVREGHDLILAGAVSHSGYLSHPHALLRRSSSGHAVSPYAPVRFVHASRPTKLHRLVVVYDAFVLARLLDTSPADGMIIYSQDFRKATVRVSPQLTHVQASLSKLRELATTGAEPQLRLNTMCNTCEFRCHCRQKAQEKDDLSLLQGITHSEIERNGKQGIFTVNQLSYTFRPRRPRKRARNPGTPRHFALQALALRESKTYIHGNVPLPESANHAYFDIEGLNERNFYYLIGAIFVEDGHAQHYNRWADEEADQPRVISDFLDRMARFVNGPVYHFGDYEPRVLRQVRAQLDTPHAEILDALLEGCVNVLSVIYPHVYFPVYRNSLKDVAQYLGYRWAHPRASGQLSVCWRYQWERSHRAYLRDRVVQYNRDDCLALRHVVAFLSDAKRFLESGDTSTSPDSRVAHTDSLIRPTSRRHRFGKAQFAQPDWDYVNKCAYFDYQRQHVLVRTSTQFRSINRRYYPKNRTRECRATAKIELTCKKCPHCRSRKLVPRSRLKRRLIDVKFTCSGVRRWIGDYVIARYECRKCGQKVIHPDAPSGATKFGHGLLAWCIYQHVVCGQNMLQVHRGLRDVFGLQLSYAQLYRFKALAAQYYADTYKSLETAIIESPVIHADETSVDLRSCKGYVWVLASLDNVYYFYRESREASFLESLLGGFAGTLVSDFFTGYDSLGCRQQKCLVHLLRDINEDILRYPFDQELR